jgi:CubicO group peptidase (beta-lactamase class C family)
VRYHLPGILIALLIFSAAAALADEVKYKSRSQPQTQDRQSNTAQYKRPPDTPRDRPPDKHRPIKEPPTRRPPDNPPPYTPPTPPPPRQPRYEEWPCEDFSPPLWDDGYESHRFVVDPAPYIPSPDPVAEELSSVLARRLRMMEMEGFAGEVTVGWYGEAYFERVYGPLYQPVTRGYYDIAGISKAFTAWAVYELVASKDLRLDTPLTDLFHNVPPDKRRITIEHLLGNTSGLGNTYAADGETDRDIAVGNLLAQPLEHEPGTAFAFSDDGYVLLAAAVEVASGMDYNSYLLDSNVISSDMKQTSFWGEVGSQEEHWGEYRSGGILTTAHDLYQWTSRFLGNSEIMVEAITRPRVFMETGEGIGYGWLWTNPGSDEPVMWSSGAGNFNHNAMVVVYPADAILVVTSDRYHGDVPWSERVANSLEPILIDAVQPSSWRLMGETSMTSPVVKSPVIRQ